MSEVEELKIYVASRASVPERPAMWRELREQGWPINSTWIDEAGEGESSDFVELWDRIQHEIANAHGVILYAKSDDFPLKGAYIECGIALGQGKPVAVVLPDGLTDLRSCKPVGSWVKHPLVSVHEDLETAFERIEDVYSAVVLDASRADGAWDANPWVWVVSFKRV